MRFRQAPAVVLSIALVGVACGASSPASPPSVASPTESAGPNISGSRPAIEPLALGPDSAALTTSLDLPEPDVGSRYEAADADAAIRQSAIDRLTRTGRANDSAACVVDQLLALGQVETVIDPQFGMGLRPLEADALAYCRSNPAN